MVGGLGGPPALAELSKFEVIGPGIIGRAVRAAQRRYFDPPNLQGVSGKWDR
jgi:hypothetical protein